MDSKNPEIHTGKNPNTFKKCCLSNWIVICRRMQIYPVHKRKTGLGKNFIKEEIRRVFRQGSRNPKMILLDHCPHFALSMNGFQNWRSCRSCTSKCSFWGDWIWLGLLLWTQQDVDPFRFAEYKSLSYSNISIYQNVIHRKVIKWLLISYTETYMITLILFFRFSFCPTSFLMVDLGLMPCFKNWLCSWGL